LNAIATIGTTADRLATVRQEIARACADAGRPSGSVTLVAVSKTFGADAIEQAIAAGQRVFGENRVQEAKAKWPLLRERHPGIDERRLSRGHRHGRDPCQGGNGDFRQTRIEMNIGFLWVFLPGGRQLRGLRRRSTGSLAERLKGAGLPSQAETARAAPRRLARPGCRPQNLAEMCASRGPESPYKYQLPLALFGPNALFRADDGRGPRGSGRTPFREPSKAF
jgi:hypothetical protein